MEQCILVTTKKNFISYAFEIFLKFSRMPRTDLTNTQKSINCKRLYPQEIGCTKKMTNTSQVRDRHGKKRYRLSNPLLPFFRLFAEWVEELRGGNLNIGNHRPRWINFFTWKHQSFQFEFFCFQVFFRILVQNVIEFYLVYINIKYYDRIVCQCWYILK